MAQRKSLGTRVPEKWLQEIDELVATKFPGRTRSDWLFRVVEHELLRQRNGNSKDARLDRLLANDAELLALLPLVKEIHQATVK